MDNETCSPCDHRSLCEEVLASLRVHWTELPAAGAIEDITLHYLDGKIHLELVLPLEWAPDRAAAVALTGEFQQRAGAVAVIGEVKLRYR